MGGGEGIAGGDGMAGGGTIGGAGMAGGSGTIGPPVSVAGICGAGDSVTGADVLTVGALDVGSIVVVDVSVDGVVVVTDVVDFSFEALSPHAARPATASANAPAHKVKWSGLSGFGLVVMAHLPGPTVLWQRIPRIPLAKRRHGLIVRSSNLTPRDQADVALASDRRRTTAADAATTIPTIATGMAQVRRPDRADSHSAT